MKPLIYIYEGDFPKGDAGFSMIKRAAQLYAGENGMEVPEDMTILREEKGKPYFTDFPVHFSLSHSESMWMCMFSDEPCGLDVQKVRKCSWEKIAERNFGDKERRYAELFGEEGFFQVWVRKEALAKYMGKGFFSDMPQTVDENTDPADSAIVDGEEVVLKEIFISDDIKCAYCVPKTGEDEEPEVRLLI